LIAALTPKLTQLAPAQRQLWPALRPSVALGFVLYGGTAISLHLGHRRSVDFDFFHEKALDKAEVRAAFPFMQAATTLQDAINTLVVLVPGSYIGVRSGVKVSFFGGMSFGRVGEPFLTADGVLEIAALEDLMAHKLRIILQRADKKDYEDIAAMIRAGCSVARGLAAARLFFGSAFQPAESLKAMAYFRDGDLPRLSPTDQETLIQAASAVGKLPGIRLQSKSLSILVARRS
jgi:hypothetical protein